MCCPEQKYAIKESDVWIDSYSGTDLITTSLLTHFNFGTKESTKELSTKKNSLYVVSDYYVFISANRSNPESIYFSDIQSDWNM